MKITVFDSYMVIKEGTGGDGTGVFETLDVLGEILSRCGVRYGFTLPHDADIEKNPTATVTLNYMDEDSLAVHLAVALWSKACRKVNDETLCSALMKLALAKRAG